LVRFIGIDSLLDELALGSLHTRLSFALMQELRTAEARRDRPRPKPRLIETLVTDAQNEQAAKDLVGAAMAPYV
jgi:hypothetical protein